ncbi:hypothetical protein TNCV_2738921 [Trichonephila clavipes]|nr:hypothetical protein TNCV_2738921 [Trichonephila clavipes]
MFFPLSLSRATVHFSHALVFSSQFGYEKADFLPEILQKDYRPEWLFRIVGSSGQWMVLPQEDQVSEGHY